MFLQCVLELLYTQVCASNLSYFSLVNMLNSHSLVSSSLVFVSLILCVCICWRFLLLLLLFFLLCQIPVVVDRERGKGNSGVVVYKNTQNRQLANLINVEYFHHSEISSIINMENHLSKDQNVNDELCSNSVSKKKVECKEKDLVCVFSSS